MNNFSKDLLIHQLSIFKQVKENIDKDGKENLRPGLCSLSVQLQNTLEDFRDSDDYFALSILRYELFAHWPLFSGSARYPINVPGWELESPEQFNLITNIKFYENWEIILEEEKHFTAEYLNLRYQLLEFCISKLEQVIPDESLPR